MGYHARFYNKVDISTIDLSNYKEFFYEEDSLCLWLYTRKSCNTKYISHEDAGEYEFNFKIQSWVYELNDLYSFKSKRNIDVILTNENFMELINDIPLVNKNQAFTDCSNFFNSYPNGLITFR